MSYVTSFPKFATYRCTLMLLYNLASPEWININCPDGILKNVICAFQKNQEHSSPTPTNFDSSFCPLSHLRKNSICILVVWSNKPDTNLERFPMTSTSSLNFVLQTVKLSPLMSTHEELVFVYDEFHEIYRKSHANIWNSVYVFRVYRRPTGRTTAATSVFRCENRVHISPLKVCNNINDCGDESDEMFWTCNSSSVVFFIHDKTLRSQLNQQLVVPSENRTSDEGLSSHSFKNLYFPTELQKNQSSSGKSVVAETGSNAGNSINEIDNRTFCLYPGEHPCRSHQQECFNVSNVCVYTLGNENNIVPCSNGAHLINCRDFECNVMFKCHVYYCLPWKYVCDANWDCPRGVDESKFCLTRLCKNMYKCTNTTICVHLHRVCDGSRDCKAGDDENFCKFKAQKCPFNCHCLLSTLLCTQLHGESSISWKMFQVVIFVNLTIGRSDLVSLESLIFLSLISTNTTITCGFFPPKSLIFLTVRQNSFEVVKSGCFEQNVHLKNVNLVKNGIKQVFSQGFAHMKALVSLNLSHNDLNTFGKDVFLETPKLKVLSLIGNRLLSLKANVFKDLSLESLETDDYHLCCAVSTSVQCDAQSPWFFTCSNLLPNFSMKACFRALSSLVFLLNLCSIILLFMAQNEKNAANTISTWCVNASEVCCGLYLYIVWIVDLLYVGSFFVVEESWRSSFFCKFALICLLFYNISDPLLLFFLSLSRFMIVKHPMDTKFKLSSFVFKCDVSIIFCSLCVSVLIWSVQELIDNKVATGLCAAFVDPRKSPIFAMTVTFCVAILQMCTSASIVVAHFGLLSELNKSDKTTASAGKTKLTRGLVVQLIFTTVAYIICWTTTNTIFLVSLFLSQYPPDMIVWAVGAVTPLNALLNPLVFVVTSSRALLRNKKEKRKMIK